MVKRLLTLVVLMLTIAGMQAQTLQVAPNRPLKRSIQHAPRKASNLDGTTVWGLGGDSQWGGLGLGNNVVGVQFSVAIHVPGNDALKGAKIEGVDIPVLDEGMTDVSVWVRNDLEGSDLAHVDVTEGFVEGKYLTVALNESVTIPEGGLYVGYDFTNAVDYCIAYAYDGEPTEGGLFLNYVYDGKASGWGDYSADFPPSMLQVYLSGLSMPDYALDLTSASSSTQMPNTPFALEIGFVSNSGKTIENLDVEVTLNGKTETKHIVLDTPLASGFNVTGSFVIEGTSPAEAGTYETIVKIVKINGEAYEGKAISTMVKNVTKLVERRTVVEEFTGTGCGWCPRGWLGMEYMKEKYPDSFIGIAMHKYNSSDPMYVSKYPSLGLTGAPSCVIDRKVEADPFNGISGEDEYGIENDFNLYNAEIPEVDVNITALWNEAKTSVNIGAQVEFLITPGNVSLVYVLTADGLKGSSDSWKQANYYAQYSASQLAEWGYKAESIFGSGGSYGTNPVAIVFNDVLIASSYKTATTNGGESLKGGEDVQTGSVYNGSYTIALPVKGDVISVLDKDLVTAVVMVVDDETGYVLNAAKAHVTTADAVRGVENTIMGQEVRYNMAGQQITTPQRGVNIMRTADGRVRKVLVK